MKGKGGQAFAYGLLLLIIIWVLSNPAGINHILNSLSAIGK